MNGKRLSDFLRGHQTCPGENFLKDHLHRVYNVEQGIASLETGGLIRLQDAFHPKLFLLFYRFRGFLVGSFLSRLFRVRYKG